MYESIELVDMAIIIAEEKTKNIYFRLWLGNKNRLSKLLSSVNKNAVENLFTLILQVNQLF